MGTLVDFLGGFDKGGEGQWKQNWKKRTYNQMSPCMDWTKEKSER
jgi:hypothetical protein